MREVLNFMAYFILVFGGMMATLTGTIGLLFSIGTGSYNIITPAALTFIGGVFAMGLGMKVLNES